jgi:ADP-ribosylglycohydrolase
LPQFFTPSSLTHTHIISWLSKKVRELMITDAEHLIRMSRARASLDGLSTGDAFGENFFCELEKAEQGIFDRTLPGSPWKYTDDTVMAISIVQVLSMRREMDQELLAELFASRYRRDPTRGYGGTARNILNRIWDGEPWREVSRSVFGGIGSLGNGGAMRAAPIGAYFSDDFQTVVKNAQLSAEVTHAHPEGQAGAIAVAIAAACVTRSVLDPLEIFDTVLRFTPDSETRARIEQASHLSLTYDVQTAVSALGNGVLLSAPDTVPFTLWCAARHLGAFKEAMWTTVSGLGDRDTTCAIVGGILCANPNTVVPVEWLAAREPLDHFFREWI